MLCEAGACCTKQELPRLYEFLDSSAILRIDSCHNNRPQGELGPDARLARDLVGILKLVAPSRSCIQSTARCGHVALWLGTYSYINNSASAWPVGGGEITYQ